MEYGWADWRKGEKEIGKRGFDIGKEGLVGEGIEGGREEEVLDRGMEDRSVET